MISVFERTIAFGLLVLCLKTLSGDSDVERFSAGNLVYYFLLLPQTNEKKKNKKEEEEKEKDEKREG